MEQDTIETWVREQEQEELGKMNIEDKTSQRKEQTRTCIIVGTRENAIETFSVRLLVLDSSE